MQNFIYIIRFKKDIKSNKELIIVENSYKKIDINIDKIFEKGYSTKQNKKDHGLGLWNVRKILSKSENLNLFTSKDKLFSQQLEITICNNKSSKSQKIFRRFKKKQHRINNNKRFRYKVRHK